MATVYDPKTGTYFREVHDPRTGQFLGFEPVTNLEADGVMPVQPGYRPEVLKRMLAGLPERKSPDQVRKELALQNPLAPQAPETFRPLAGLMTENRGNSVRLLPVASIIGAFTNARAETIVSTPPDNGRDAEIITVTYGYEPEGRPPGSLLAGSSQIRGILTWGVGGAQFQTEFDWNQGGSFSIAASFLRVGANYETNAAAPVPLWLSASLAYGVTAKRSNTLRITTAPLPTGVSILPAGIVDFTVPRFATSFVIGAPNSAAPVDLGLQLQTNIGGRTLALYQYSNVTNIGDQREDQFVIPNGAGQLRMTNNGLAAVTNGSIVWNLGL